MNEPHGELATRIRREVADLDLAVRKIGEVWTKSEQVTEVEKDIYIDSAALNIHGFYSGIERLFELIARHIDQIPVGGNTWHRDLLRQMAREVDEVRPAVIGPRTAEALDEFRRFRHLVRNVYASTLDPEKMTSLLGVMPKMWAKLKEELVAFADFLDALAQHRS